MRKNEQALLEISSKKCTGCELCATICPCHIVHMVIRGKKEYAVLSEQNKYTCIGCLNCIEICEVGAIKLAN